MAEPVIIVGGGPSGAAAAIALCNLGMPCVVLDAERESFKPGESLPPNAAPVLANLGIHNLLCTGEHQTYRGIHAFWGSTTGEYRHFFAEPHGNGWHLNRHRFEASLRETATARGAVWLQGWKFIGMVSNTDHVTVTVTDTNGHKKPITGTYVIDCSGRASIVPKSQGATRHVMDKLMAFYTVVSGQPSFTTGTTYIESVSNGWWYAAPAASNGTILYFMTDSDLLETGKKSREFWFRQLLENTRELREKLPDPQTLNLSPVMIKTATTSATSIPFGNRWIAAGDALFTLDPLASFGITAALHGGHLAAKTVAAVMNGDKNAIQAYKESMGQTFNVSLTMLRNQYQLERHWQSKTFWKRRQ